MRAMRKKLQKQSLADILQNRCSKKFYDFHEKKNCAAVYF